MRIGVDFGTTHTVVALCDRGNYPVLGFVDADGESHDWFPSVAAVRGAERRYGFDALDVAADPTWTVLRSFKRLLGGPEASLGRTIDVGGGPVAVAELVAGFLRGLRDAIRGRSNLPRALRDDPRLEAVVAVPANAHGTQRLVTLDAFRAAELDVRAVLNEPSAAGFEYTHRHRTTISSRRDHVVVYDLGGGTFDASLLAMRERHHEVVQTTGINQLGGDDFDAVLAELALAAAGVPSERLRARERAALLDVCRDAKEGLSPQSRKVAIDLEACLGADSPVTQVTVGTAELYAACEPLIARSIDAMAPLLGRLAGEQDEHDVAGIYVVGGASALPAVGRALRDRFGRRVHRSPYPFASTAIGLAIAADDDAGFSLSDRFSRTFGVFREARAGREAAFDAIFGAEAALPAAGDGVSHRRRYRAAHNVGVFRFVECSALDDAGAPRGDLTPLGDVWFPFDPRLAGVGDLAEVPVERTETGPLVEEEYSIDARGVVHVAIRNVEAGYGREFEVGRI
jgi:molecular chaperone DnaK (HSP70)